MKKIQYSLLLLSLNMMMGAAESGFSKPHCSFECYDKVITRQEEAGGRITIKVEQQRSLAYFDLMAERQAKKSRKRTRAEADNEQPRLVSQAEKAYRRRLYVEEFKAREKETIYQKQLHADEVKAREKEVAQAIALTNLNKAEQQAQAIALQRSRQEVRAITLQKLNGDMMVQDDTARTFSFEDIVEEVAGMLDLNYWITNKADSNGNTIFHFAALLDAPHVLRWLLSLKDLPINPNQPNKFKKSALALAHERNSLGAAKVLIRSDKVKLSEQLKVSFQMGRLDCILYALSKDLKSIVNRPINQSGDTPLLSAVKFNRPEVVQVLLGCLNVDINKQNVDGDTALICAVRGKCYGILDMLLQHNPNPTLVNRAGESAFSYFDMNSDWGQKLHRCLRHYRK